MDQAGGAGRTGAAYCSPAQAARSTCGPAGFFRTRIGCEKIMSTMGSSGCPAAGAAPRPPSGRPQASPTRAVPVRLLPRLLESAGGTLFVFQEILDHRLGEILLGRRREQADVRLVAL